MGKLITFHKTQKKNAAEHLHSRCRTASVVIHWTLLDVQQKESQKDGTNGNPKRPTKWWVFLGLLQAYLYRLTAEPKFLQETLTVYCKSKWHVVIKDTNIRHANISCHIYLKLYLCNVCLCYPKNQHYFSLPMFHNVSWDACFHLDPWAYTYTSQKGDA